ncbi:MAG: deoxyribose-phosphate aldolase [Ignavibacteriales bacterium]|nr:deoxyribose-phosphate aldolase [Ignavibacteriales bacterium]
MPSLIDKVVSRVFLEKSLNEFYCRHESCDAWEKNVVQQPGAVRAIVDSGADRVAAGPGVGEELTDERLARMIDHTLLKPEATPEEIVRLCEEAARYRFASVCVNPCHARLCADKLEGTGVAVCVVVGFPLGANCADVKRVEAERALRDGATEIDMVINVGRLKSDDYEYVFDEIRAVATECKRAEAILKVIIETSLLSDEEKVKACVVAKEAGAHFVKTSTGFAKGGATAADVALMKYVVGSTVGVKASGGVKTRADAEKMIASGAERIGASAGVRILLDERDIR